MENPPKKKEIKKTRVGGSGVFIREVADVWEKDVWEFQAKSGSSGSCGLFLHFLGKSAVQEGCLGKRLEVPDVLLPDIRGLLIHLVKKGVSQRSSSQVQRYENNNTLWKLLDREGPRIIINQ